MRNFDPGACRRFGLGRVALLLFSLSVLIVSIGVIADLADAPSHHMLIPFAGVAIAAVTFSTVLGTWFDAINGLMVIVPLAIAVWNPVIAIGATPLFWGIPILIRASERRCASLPCTESTASSTLDREVAANHAMDRSRGEGVLE